ncbi:MAG: tetratricopeptide repeat protein, partial [Pirellula sp.]|nr:tetratricopeptide repeat protein [Pirellula sp.]
STPPSPAMQWAEPMVSRVELRLTIGDKEVDVIEQGDLVTILEDRGDRFLVRTFRGVKGVVEKVNLLALKESVEVYDALVKSQPGVGRLYTLRAGAQWARGDGEAALKDFDEAIRLGYDTANAISSRALFLSATQQHEKAIEDFSKAMEKGEKTEANYINRAASYMQLNQIDKAIADYSEAFALNEKNAGVLQQRATAYKVKGDLDKAIQDFSKAIELAPKFIPAIMGRGYIYFQTGDHTKAIGDFSKVIELNDRASVAYNNRGYNWQLMGKEREAFVDFEKSVELDPNYALAHQNLAWLLATCNDRTLRDPVRAIASATRACELNQYNDLSDMAALAASHAANEEFDLAIGIQEKIFERAPEEQKQLAKKLLELYRENKPFDPQIGSETSSSKSSLETPSKE